MFSFDDVENRNSGGFIQKAATVTAVTISGLASFQFFATYSGALLAGLVPPAFLSIAAGLIGLIVCEGACLYWQWSVQHDADSKGQLAIAQAGYVVSLIVSVTITCLYFLLTSQLVSPYLSDIKHIIDGFAALVLIGVIGFQFVAKVQYSHVATQAAKAAQDAQIRAMANDAQYLVRQQSTRADLQNSLAELQRVLPEHSARKGQATSAQFIRERYGVNGNSPKG